MDLSLSSGAVACVYPGYGLPGRRRLVVDLLGGALKDDTLFGVGYDIFDLGERCLSQWRSAAARLYHELTYLDLLGRPLSSFGAEEA